MSEVTLAQLAAFAVVAQSKSRTAIQDLSIEEARSKVTVADSSKVASEDGSQKLVVRLGKHNLPLDVVAPKAQSIMAAKDSVDTFKAVLNAAVTEGKFDEAIVAVQNKIKEAAIKRAEAAANKGTENESGSDSGVAAGESTTEPEADTDTASSAESSPSGDTATDSVKVTEEEAADAAGFDMSLLDAL